MRRPVWFSLESLNEHLADLPSWCVHAVGQHGMPAAAGSRFRDAAAAPHVMAPRLCSQVAGNRRQPGVAEGGL